MHSIKYSFAVLTYLESFPDILTPTEHRRTCPNYCPCPYEDDSEQRSFGRGFVERLKWTRYRHVSIDCDQHHCPDWIHSTYSSDKAVPFARCDYRNTQSWRHIQEFYVACCEIKIASCSEIKPIRCAAVGLKQMWHFYTHIMAVTRCCSGAMASFLSAVPGTSSSD